MGFGEGFVLKGRSSVSEELHGAGTKSVLTGFFPDFQKKLQRFGKITFPVLVVSTEDSPIFSESPRSDISPRRPEMS